MRQQIDPSVNLIIWLRPKKKLFVSCNPTLTSFYSKKCLPLSFFHLPTPNQRKTWIKHTFLTKKIMQKFFFYRPTYPIYLRTVTGNKQFLFLGLTKLQRCTWSWSWLVLKIQYKCRIIYLKTSHYEYLTLIQKYKQWPRSDFFYYTSHV